MTSLRTVLTTASARNVDLMLPTGIDLADIAEHLSKINRYNGATPGVTYSVAEHSVRCADAAMKATGDTLLAAYLLCHDMHEAYLGDDTTPKKRALDATAAKYFGILGDAITKAFGKLTDELDVVIHDAAGLTWPTHSGLQTAVKRWDTILLATEWRDLMRCPPPYDFGQDPLPDTIEPWPWDRARDTFMCRCFTLLPTCKKQLAISDIGKSFGLDAEQSA